VEVGSGVAELANRVYQVRKYHAWYRHITLSMLAAAFLVVTACTEHLRREKGEPPPTTNSYHPYPATKSDDSGPS